MLALESLHPLIDFIPPDRKIASTSPDYWYEGTCPKTGDRLRLPRTPLAKAIAHSLMQQLEMQKTMAYEGKMYGILLVETCDRTQFVLKAFSGLWQGKSTVAGWVPAIPGRDQLVLAETLTLKELEVIKQELISLQQLPERQHYQTQLQVFEHQLQQLTHQHQQRKQERQYQRQKIQSSDFKASQIEILQQLDEQSRRDGSDRRQLKRLRDLTLHPLKQAIDQADARIQTLKQQRKALSRQLQAQMHTHYYLTNFAGESLSLQQLQLRGALPTGTGDCCAPKLLHYAATHGLKPLAMAEFWWGVNSPKGDKVPGEFYEACVDRCQPILGFLLSGLSTEASFSETVSPQPAFNLLNSNPQEIALLPLPNPLQQPKSSREAAQSTIQNPRSSQALIFNPPEPLTILYEDEALIVVNKPTGLLSVPGRYHDRQDSVLSRLQYQLPDGRALIPVHRLDQDTSGILLLARDCPTATHLRQQFQQQQVQKVYEAVLAGTVTDDKGMIDLPLWSDPNDRPYQKVDQQRGKRSLTRFQVIARTANMTRITFFPVTGRTHQLRVHAADPQGLGIPILGDRLYQCPILADRLHLHAQALHFRNPHTGTWVHLQSSPPF
ncbi:MAG: RluA family pseudouridine synthase [Scytolyngbya sp. HA4215-MV1]|jgi:tRNA pseudouridine32 synthase/23S rRNA pseudouridine746 synthase|nr:RluA family pseudouridine synthase [Scytolyngbya sp. HA4215-MV1]